MCAGDIVTCPISRSEETSVAFTHPVTFLGTSAHVHPGPDASSSMQPFMVDEINGLFFP